MSGKGGSSPYYKFAEKVRQVSWARHHAASIIPGVLTVILAYFVFLYFQKDGDSTLLILPYIPIYLFAKHFLAPFFVNHPYNSGIELLGWEVGYILFVGLPVILILNRFLPFKEYVECTYDGCEQAIKVRYQWRCDHCGEVQKKPSYITESCQICGSMLTRFYCPRCKREFKL